MENFLNKWKRGVIFIPELEELFSFLFFSLPVVLLHAVIKSLLSRICSYAYTFSAVSTVNLCKTATQNRKTIYISLMANGRLMKVESVAECPHLGEFCNTFDLHEAIISLVNQFLVLLRVAVLHRF